MNGQRKPPGNPCDVRLRNIEEVLQDAALSSGIAADMQQIREELQAVRDDIAVLTEKLEPVIAMSVRVHHALDGRARDTARERVQEMEEPEHHDDGGWWQRRRCRRGKHTRSEADWSNENAIAKCLYCRRVVKF